MGRRVEARNELLITITGVALILTFFLIVTFRDIVNLVMYNTP